MRLILFDSPQQKRRGFHPLALCRPVWQLRCGITTLEEKIVARTGPASVAYFVPDYMAETFRAQASAPVNDPACLRGDDLLLVNERVKAEGLRPPEGGRSEVFATAEGEVLCAVIRQGDLGRLKTDSLASLLESARKVLPPAAAAAAPATWNYVWELVLASPDQITADFVALGRSGVEGRLEQPSCVRGGAKDVYVARGAAVHPMAVLDASAGPVYIDAGAQVHPFTRVEGPCYLGRDSILLGAKCRGGNSIGPMCRVGGEIEAAVLQGYSNKYHDGFLGHAYVGEWVNIGAMTCNSDLRNDYGNVSVTLEGRELIDTGGVKFGCLIGDHAKTSIGTLFNTGACLGAMTLVAAAGRLLPKFIPSFAAYLKGRLTEGFARERLYATAATCMARRQRTWTAAEAAMWDRIYALTAPDRQAAEERQGS
jgi:UDP-N-acetylglucosamine diphosphorylase/glucosamine-1-phosphate N-acetyltransferase